MISPLFGYLAMELEHLVTAGSLDKLLNLALHAHDLEVDGDELVAAHDGRLNLCFSSQVECILQALPCLLPSHASRA